MKRNMSGRCKVVLVFLSFFCLLQTVSAKPLTLPLDKRPEWLRREGIVMAGSWAPLPFSWRFVFWRAGYRRAALPASTRRPPCEPIERSASIGSRRPAA